MSIAELTLAREEHVTRFLAARGLDRDWLLELVRERVGESHHLLLTSSAVHGLANRTSDVDMIRIQAQELAGPRIGTKIFAGGHHLEVISFSRAEVDAAMVELGRLAGESPTAVVAGYRRWDRCREPRRKHTERIVNGIGLDGGAPYVSSLPALSQVWMWSALQTGLEQTLHLALAEAAGELMGRVGYAINALLHLMDAILSKQSDVYTTRKWYLLRWRRFVSSGAGAEAPLAELVGRLDRLRREVNDHLLPGNRHHTLGPDYVSLAAAALAQLGGVTEVAIQPHFDPEAVHRPYLPGASILTWPGGTTVLEDRDLVEAGPTLRPEEFLRLPEDRARALLRLLRLGVLQLSIDYGRRSA